MGEDTKIIDEYILLLTELVFRVSSNIKKGEEGIFYDWDYTDNWRNTSNDVETKFTVEIRDFQGVYLGSNWKTNQFEQYLQLNLTLL